MSLDTQVGVSSVWFEGNPCNMHLLDLAKEAKDGVTEAGMVGYRFNTIGVSDGISMGTRGECRVPSRYAVLNCTARLRSVAAYPVLLVQYAA